MKKIIYLLSLVAVFSCHKSKNENSDIKEFFDTMAEIECIDSSQNKFNLTFKYSFFNEEKISFDYLIPDSIPNSVYYNAYAGRLISTYYNRIRSDTTISFDELLTVDKCDEELVRKKVTNYFEHDQTVNGIFILAKSSFYENENIKKPKFTIDSLVNISMSYFDIVDYSEERGFSFHFVCGANPIDFSYQNTTALLICDFCQEALKNPEMRKAFSSITDSIGRKIKVENDNLNDFPKIKMVYEPKLHDLLKEEKILKESLIFYYEKRKEIEPFILEY